MKNSTARDSIFRENLMTDRFLRCQMDNDQYVPIRIIAGFPKVKRLTSDYNLVVKVLRGFFVIIDTVVFGSMPFIMILKYAF